MTDVYAKCMTTVHLSATAPLTMEADVEAYTNCQK
jgi:hypothetical protein